MRTDQPEEMRADAAGAEIMEQTGSQEAGAQDAGGPPASGATAVPEGGEECPPPMIEGDAERDMSLLKAIAAHPKAAQFLAELAGGGDEAELLRKHFPRQPAMYQPVQAPALRPCTSFLSHVSNSFWD